MTQLIDTLHAIISPKVLDAVSVQGSDDNKKSILTSLYTLLITKLSDTAVVNHLETALDATQDDGAALWSALLNQDEQRTFVQEVANHTNTAGETITALAVTALPLAYQHLKGMANGVPLAQFVKEEQTALLASMPAWLLAALPTGLVTHTQSVTPQPLASTADTPKEDKGNFLKSLLPLVGALIVGLLAWVLLRACQQTPTTVAAPSAPSALEVAKANAIPAKLHLVLDGTGQAVQACHGQVGNDILIGQLQTILTKALPTATCQFDVVEKTAATMPVSQYLPQLLGFMKGVPNASITVEDKHIYVSASTPEALDKLLADVKTALPEFTVEAEAILAPANTSTDNKAQADTTLNVEEATNTAIDAANAAIDELGNEAKVEDLVKALNLQIINFAVGSSDIPVANQKILDKAAALMKDKDNIKLDIIGHTDSSGNAEKNQALSQARAEAVKAYLVSKGVSADSLSAHGAGSSKPIADNNTAEGKFKNRRIEFAVAQ